ncbi:MHCK/EF2 kinase domain protein (macronuclear) [Tetrahymena thermophila SB210]|uniref:MHCK/EF2 kinase domain protein n=1 Tax=Tetrahymena thermophila (strain SB210) TaxID=312017 RepID=I7LV46_TETTS|nr:MHCK/EF2 kinase domain protein [Tetrahymena thermophila SB210]EAR97192.2 MHCK/EF2 kinase domain protein [Tetrahymena thermophila SB210]|eukprot:XP_001017437.2 MHCK/EF2 kinase domain protein [Tetrahymena thermophila SB210]
MSNLNIQKHLPCHDYHMGQCLLPKAQCPYSHDGKSWGICPNKNHCPTPHKLVDCPLFLNNCCPRGDNCSYRHKKTDENGQEIKEEQIVQDKASSDEIQIQQDSENTANKKQIIKGMTLEDFKSSLVELNQDLKIIMPIIQSEKDQSKKWNSSCSLDLCFIVDITGSMSPWMNQVVQYVGNTLKTIYEDFPAIDLRVAFSGYRDHCDQHKYVTYDFTRNVDSFRSQLAQVTCLGGGDCPEDVTGGLHNALNFDWGSSAQQAVFIADSPAHGVKYHENIADDYPNGCPNGRKLEDLMIQFSQKKIDFTVVEISGMTKKMFSIMTQCYGQNLVIKNLSSGTAINGPTSFQHVMHEQIKSTVTASLSKSGLSGGGGPQIQVSGKSGKAFKAIMESKKFKKNFSWSRSKEKSSKIASTIIQEQIQEQQVLEEEEYDSDDSEYETKLEQTAQKQLKQAIKDKAIRIQKEREERLEKLKQSFPSHYFDTVEQHDQKNKKKQKEKICKVQYHNGPFDWNKFESFNDYQAICYSFELVKNYKGNQEINWKNLEIKTFYLGTKVRLSNLVFSEGAMRYAYHAKDLYLNQKMVAKQYKKPEKQTKISIEEMKRDIISQIVCKYIVKEFNSKLVEIEKSEALILQFIDCYIYETTHPYNSSPRYYFEKYIDGTYEKFNNNAGYVSQTDNLYSPLAQALSHFSWQISKGYLAIVDLQGNHEGILTDPQVHCLDQEKFGDGNLGYEGILRFFSTHECNDYCRKLQLIHPFEQSQIPLNNTFFLEFNNSDQNSIADDSQALMSQLCDICQSASSFSIKQIIESKKNNTRLVCFGCIEQIKKTTFSKKCVQCPQQLQFSTYECIQLRRDAPPLCTSCQSKQ